MTPDVIVHHPIPDDLRALLNGLGYAAVQESSSYTRFTRTRSSTKREQLGRQPVGRPEPTERALYTPEQTAALLGVGRTTVYKLINAGKLHSVTIGRCRRIAATELERFVEALTGTSLDNIASSAGSSKRSADGAPADTRTSTTFDARRNGRKRTLSSVGRAEVRDKGPGVSVPLGTLELPGTLGASQPPLPLDPYQG